MNWFRDIFALIRGPQFTPLGDSPQSFQIRHQHLQEMFQDALHFWKKAVDWKRGGFFGLIDLEGHPVEDAPKDLIQQVRHLWTFSQIFRFEDPSESIAEICHHQFRFVRDSLYRPKEACFHREVTASGEALPGPLHHYPLSFCLFGLSNYATAFSHLDSGREAFDMVLTTLKRLVAESWDDEFGFDETVYPGRWCRDHKEINTQMHLLEALGEFYEAAQTHQRSQDLAHRLLFRQLHLICQRSIVERNGVVFCSAGYDKDWSLRNDHHIEYGHDIEVVYLAWHAATKLQLEETPEVRDPILALAHSTHKSAFDSRLGKWYYAGEPLTRKPRHKISNIWTNFEALNGLATAYRLSGELYFLNTFDRILDWLRLKQVNPKTGEWYYNVDWRGRPVKTGVYGEDCNWMSFPWKSSYHSLRAIIYCKAWLSESELKPALLRSMSNHS